MLNLTTFTTFLYLGLLVAGVSWCRVMVGRKANDRNLWTILAVLLGPAAVVILATREYPDADILDNMVDIEFESTNHRSPPPVGVSFSRQGSNHISEGSE